MTEEMKDKSDLHSDAKGNGAAGKNPFPYTGIFSPHGFLSTIPTSQKQSPIKHPEEPELESVQKRQSECHQAKGRFQGPRKKLKLKTEFKHETEILPSEAALAIDHIRENIFGSLPKADLLACRRVSHRWLTVLTPILQKIVKIKFLAGITDASTNRIESFCYRLQYNLDNFSWDFPCNKFVFFSSGTFGSLSCLAFQNFLSIYGPYIRDLTIQCKLPENEAYAEGLVAKLISKQCRNLQALSLHLFTETEFSLNSDKVLLHPEKLRPIDENVNLKTVEMGKNPSPALLQMVLRTSPNVNELILSKGDYKYFIEPTNRIHLIKKVHLDPLILEISTLEKIVFASLDLPGSLKIREIIIQNWGQFCGRLNFRNSVADREAKAILVFNHLFDYGWDTLETIHWSEAFFLKGMKWPKVMPKVTTVHLEALTYPYTDNVNLNVREGGRVFPEGFSLSGTFPKLKNIHLCHSGRQVDFAYNLNLLNPKQLQCSSVKHVFISHHSRDKIEEDALDLELLRQLFPGAEIHNE